MSVRQLKLCAKQTMNGKWLQSISAVCILVALYSSVNMCAELVMSVIGAMPGEWTHTAVSFIATAIALFLVVPLAFGIRRYIFLMKSGEPISVIEIFSPFGKGYARIIGLRLSVYIRALAAGVIQYIGAYVCFSMISGMYFSVRGTAAVWLGIATSVLACSGVIASIFVIVRYFLSDYLLILRPDLKKREILKLSASLMKGNKARLLDMYLRCLPWFILCITGIAIPFVISYYEAVAAQFAKKILEEDRNP